MTLVSVIICFKAGSFFSSMSALNISAISAVSEGSMEFNQIAQQLQQELNAIDVAEKEAYLMAEAHNPMFVFDRDFCRNKR